MIVGAGLGSAAKGSGTRVGKRAASLSPPKPRISLNFDGHGHGLAHGVQNEPDASAGAKNKTTWSRVKPANDGVRATNVLGKARLLAKSSPTCNWAEAKEQECPAGQPKAKLPPTRHMTASNKLDWKESITRKEEAGGAQDDFLNEQNLDRRQLRSGCGV